MSLRTLRISFASFAVKICLKINRVTAKDAKNTAKIAKEPKSSSCTTFVPVDAHNLPVLMCNYTGKEVV